MSDVKYFVYINEQSTKPLVHSMAEAKEHATRNIRYKPSIRIECYSMQSKIGEWIYDYTSEKWFERTATHSGAPFASARNTETQASAPEGITVTPECQREIIQPDE
jgi:hypothetical protein